MLFKHIFLIRIPITYEYTIIQARRGIHINRRKTHNTFFPAISKSSEWKYDTNENIATEGDWMSECCFSMFPAFLSQSKFWNHVRSLSVPHSSWELAEATRQTARWCRAKYITCIHCATELSWIEQIYTRLPSRMAVFSPHPSHLHILFIQQAYASTNITL